MAEEKVLAEQPPVADAGHDSSDRPSEEKIETSADITKSKDHGYDPDDEFGAVDFDDPVADRALLWKLDRNLIPWLSLLYLISFLDRTNIGNAKLAGLPQDLNLSKDGTQFNISLTVFFISYALFEPLTNIMLKRFRPSRFIPISMVIWGLIMALMGVTENFSGLAAARFFLGLAEAGLFPGVSYLLSAWYKRSEFGIRQAIFFSAAALAGSFGGLLAYAIEKMDGVGGRGGWAWIFILEGCLTIVISLASFWMVPDFPDEATFLTPEERARVVHRLKGDGQAAASHETFQMEYFWQAVKDPKTWFQCLIYMGTDGSLYAFSLFLPTIISSLGKYNAVQSQLLTIPPYAVATVLTVVVGFGADRLKQRGLINAGLGLIGMVGFAMLLSGASPSVAYAGTFLGAMGIYPTIANTIAWGANNFEGVYKRGVAMGIFIGWGNLNGIVSSNIYIQKTAPRYIPGHAVVLGYLSVGLFLGSIAQYFYLRRENGLRRAGRRDHWIEGKSAEEIARMGDQRPDFIYTL